MLKISSVTIALIEAIVEVLTLIKGVGRKLRDCVIDKLYGKRLKRNLNRNIKLRIKPQLNKNGGNIFYLFIIVLSD